MYGAATMTINKLQRVQNLASSVQVQRSDGRSTFTQVAARVTRSLHWHTIFVHPQRRHICQTYHIPWHLRFRRRLSTPNEIGRRAFSVAAPTVWNSLPAQQPN